MDTGILYLCIPDPVVELLYCLVIRPLYCRNLSACTTLECKKTITTRKMFYLVFNLYVWRFNLFRQMPCSNMLICYDEKVLLVKYSRTDLQPASLRHRDSNALI